ALTDYAREIEANAERMEQMIHALLDLSSAGRNALEVREIDTGALVDSVLRDLAAGGALAGVVRLGDLPPARGDAVLLRQVWTNLIGNALKYSRDSAAPQICIAGSRRDGAVEYSVQDNRVGFDMRH